jgi:hypothetical protein
MTASRASDLVEKRLMRWDAAASEGGWKMAWGAWLSLVKGVGAGRVEA